MDEIIFWLTGYDQDSLQQAIDQAIDFETFFAEAPKMNPNASLITGVICGYRVEEIEDKLMQQIRYLINWWMNSQKGKNGEDFKEIRKKQPDLDGCFFIA